MADSKENIFKFGSADATAIQMDEGMDEVHHHIEAKPYINPYIAGMGVGLALLLAFVFMGRGLGASGGVSVAVSTAVETIDQQAARNNGYFSHYLNPEGSSLLNWSFFLVAGVMSGAFFSGTLGGRVKLQIEKGPRVSNMSRLLLAFSGGMIMGFGAKMARGCTSGQGLTGGAQLNLGSWVIMLCIFGAAYLLAYFVRRQWR